MGISGIHDSALIHQASAQKKSKADDSEKKVQSNGLYKRLAEAAKKGFIYFCKSSSRGLILTPSTITIGSLGPRRTERLRFLGLSRCQLRLLPGFVSDLASLETLQLQHNHLRTLPDWIGKLTKLKYLDVSGNLLRILPDSIDNCSDLVELDANLNKLEDLPSTFGSLKRLQRVHMNMNNLSILPTSCNSLTSLRYIDLRFNKFQELPKSIGNLQPLDLKDYGIDCLPQFVDLSCSGAGEFNDNAYGAFSVEVTMYNYQTDSSKLPNEISKCFDGQLKNMATIVLLDGNPVIVPPMSPLYVCGTATLEKLVEVQSLTGEVKNQNL